MPYAAIGNALVINISEDAVFLLFQYFQMRNLPNRHRWISLILLPRLRNVLRRGIGSRAK